jgi:hypothetical protein
MQSKSTTGKNDKVALLLGQGDYCGLVPPTDRQQQQ